MDDLKKAKELLTGNTTCVICKNESVYSSDERGVKPLVEWLKSGVCFRDFSAADKVVGRATAFLYVLLGVKEVYARVISTPALEVLNNFGIKSEYTSLVDGIINRRGDGICPFESAVLDTDDAETAYELICRKLSSM